MVMQSNQLQDGYIYILIHRCQLTFLFFIFIDNLFI